MKRILLILYLLFSADAHALTEKEGQILTLCYGNGNGEPTSDGHVIYKKGFEKCAKIVPKLEAKYAGEKKNAKRAAPQLDELIN